MIGRLTAALGSGLLGNGLSGMIPFDRFDNIQSKFFESIIYYQNLFTPTTAAKFCLFLKNLSTNCTDELQKAFLLPLQTCIQKLNNLIQQFKALFLYKLLILKSELLLRLLTRNENFFELEIKLYFLN